MSNNQDLQNNDIPTQEQTTNTSNQYAKMSYTSNGERYIRTIEEKQPHIIIKNFVNTPLNQIIADIEKNGNHQLPNNPTKKQLVKHMQSKIEKMLAQQIIFGLFQYELLYSYNHALPSHHQKSCPCIASSQSSQITLNYHQHNATEPPVLLI